MEWKRQETVKQKYRSSFTCQKGKKIQEEFQSRVCSNGWLRVLFQTFLDQGSPSDMVTFEQKPKEGEGLNGKCVLGRRISPRKDTKAVLMASFQKSREASRTRAKTTGRRVVIDKSRERTSGGVERMIAHVRTELNYQRREEKRLWFLLLFLTLFLYLSYLSNYVLFWLPCNQSYFIMHLQSEYIQIFFRVHIYFENELHVFVFRYSL